MEPPKQTPLREIDFSYYIKHYFLLLWRWKWWIVISGPIVSMVVLIYLVKFAPAVPELSSTALIGIENTTSPTAVIMNFVDIDNSKAELISTRNFLNDIVKKLSLQLAVKKYPRSAVFKNVKADSSALKGKYVFKIDKENNKLYSITYSDRRLFSKKSVIATGKMSNLDKINLPGIVLEFAEDYFKEPHDITFVIDDMPKAIENLHGNLTIKRPDFRQQINYIEVSLKGRDYKLIAEILNTIADAFVYKKLMFKRRKTLNVLEALEKQYNKAKNELSIAESRLRNFRTQNPTVGLSQSAEQTVNTMIEMETSTFSTKNALKDAKDLQGKFRQAAPEDKAHTAEEILVFLNSQNNTASPVLQEDLSRLLTEQRALQQDHASNHPAVIKNKEEIRKIVDKTQSALAGFINNIGDKLWEQTSEVKSLSQKIQRLPTKELQLAKLKRQHEVNAGIYSTILDRYNTAKVAETVEVADTYVMDYAVPPIPPPTGLLKIIGICMLIGLAVALGIPILFDLIRKTARTEFELQKMIPIPVIESIPLIVASGKSQKDNENYQSKLLTSEFKQEYIKEVIRSLRTKLVMGLHNYDDKSVAITSLDPSVGKSTLTSNIAISLAQQNSNTLLIDGDLRRGPINKFFSLEPSPGLSEILISHEELSEDNVTKYIQQTQIESLSIITSGEFVSHSADLLMAQRFAELKKRLSTMFDFILIDTPPLGSLTDAVVIHECFSRYILVVKAGVTNIVDLKKKINEYPALKKKILGIILNYTVLDKMRSYYKYSKYY